MTESDLKEKFNLDDSNFEYFLFLYRNYQSGKKSDTVELFEPSRNQKGKKVAYSTANAPKDLLKTIPQKNYRELDPNAKASGTTLWQKKMQGGVGSGISRKTYLSRLTGIPVDKVRIGSKGTDLRIRIPHPENGSLCEVTLAEAQILQGILSQRNGEYREVWFQDLVGPETKDALEAVWKKPCLLSPGQTYQAFVGGKGLRLMKPVFQAQLPTINTDGELTHRRKAPGGHAFFGVEALKTCLRLKVNQPTVMSLGNGEDLSSHPHSNVVDWITKEKIALLMVLTEKTGVDFQGGQIAIVADPKSPYITLIETAQAKEAGQLSYFEKLGLEEKSPDQSSYFNTNVALLNVGVLGEKLRRLEKEMGFDALFTRLMPDRIDRWKTQIDSDGVARKYLQLEGAMGSVFLNLDRLWRERYQEPLVHFLMVSKEDRTHFFSPIKNPFDFFMQFESDHFKIDSASLRLVNLRPGKIPKVKLEPVTAWEDLETVLAAFKGCSIVDLEELEVQGLASFVGKTLKGRVV